MPNHTSQRLIVRGTPEQLEAVKNFVRYEEKNKDGVTEKVLDFSENAFFPMPEELRGTISGSNAVVTQEEYDAYYANQENVERAEKFGTGHPITVDTAVYLKIKYGHDNWYDWALDNWGTKWGTYNCTEWSDDEERQMSIYFESAWSTATRIIQRLSLSFPDVEFELSYIDEGWCFAGKDTITNGVVVEEPIEPSATNPDFVELADLLGIEVEVEEEEEEIAEAGVAEEDKPLFPSDTAFLDFVMQNLNDKPL